VEITYTTEAAKLVYELLLPTVKNRACPFCRKRLTVANFAGFFFYEKEPRLLHKNIVCLMDFVYYREELDHE
jgi:hypothetical protein